MLVIMGSKMFCILADSRDGSGRLYSAIDADLVRDTLRAATLLIDEEVTSASSGNVIHRIVARK